jgi:hypothetical protein
MRIGLLTSMIAIGSVIVLPGCGFGANAPSEPVRPSPTDAASPIPPVKNPRDVAAMARRTCELLTPQQAKGFNLDLPPTQRDGLFGTLDCEWTSTTRERQVVRTVDISLFTNNLTLEAVYDRRQGLPFFELTEIAGYPATVSRANVTQPFCDIEVKPAENQSVSVTYYSKEFSNNPQESCEMGKQVAAAVLMNLPPKG